MIFDAASGKPWKTLLISSLGNKKNLELQLLGICHLCFEFQHSLWKVLASSSQIPQFGSGRHVHSLAPSPLRTTILNSKLEDFAPGTFALVVCNGRRASLKFPPPVLLECATQNSKDLLREAQIHFSMTHTSRLNFVKRPCEVNQDGYDSLILIISMAAAPVHVQQRSPVVHETFPTFG